MIMKGIGDMMMFLVLHKHGMTGHGMAFRTVGEERAVFVELWGTLSFLS